MLFFRVCLCEFKKAFKILSIYFKSYLFKYEVIFLGIQLYVKFSFVCVYLGLSLLCLNVHAFPQA